MADEGIDWGGVEEPMVRQILAQGEAFMQAQLQAALAADSRATAMTGLYITLALASFAAGFGYWDKSANTSPLLAGLFAGITLALASALAAWAARPVVSGA